MTIEEPTLSRAVTAYTNFEVSGKPVQIPYFLYPKNRRWRFWEYTSKESVAKLRRLLERLATGEGFDLTTAPSSAIEEFMQKHWLGVDCSGFAYQVLNPLVREKTGRGIRASLLRSPTWYGSLERTILAWRWQMRIGAKHLSSDWNSRPVEPWTDLRPGDLLTLTPRNHQRYHIAVVVFLDKDESGTLRKVTYAHSSRNTLPSGPHLATIKVDHPDRGLEKQTWFDKLRDGGDFYQAYFRVADGAGVRRLRCLDF